jgi:DNA polymerase-1
MPDDLRPQLDRIQTLVAAFNMPILALDGYEADDVIGTTAPQAEAQGVDVQIVTGDRDLLQLLTDSIHVQLPRRNENDVVYDVALFREEYGLEPLQLIELKALVGDTSDNIPGVKGVGDKTATTLLQQYQTVDNLYAHLDEIKGATQKKLIEGRDSAYLSHNLARIRRDVPITLDLKACLSHDFDVATVDALFGELEFRTLRNLLPKAAAQLTMFAAEATAPAETPAEEAAAPVIETVIVRDEATLRELVEALNAAPLIAFDTETTSTDQMAARLVGISLAVSGERGYYIPVGHVVEQPLLLGLEAETDSQQLPLQQVVEALRPALTNPTIGKVAHNASYDVVMLQRHGLDIAPVTFDTMVAEWLRSPESKFLRLKNLARQELDVHMTEISDLIGTGKKQITMDTVPIERAAPYAAADAGITLRLTEKLRPELEKANLLELMQTLEIPLIPVIVAMERAGVRLNIPYLAHLSDRMQDMLSALEQTIFDLSGGYGSFNINSPKQLNDVLFSKLGLPVQGLKKTTHGFSTDASVLEGLKGAHPIVEKILDYREVAKLKNTYVDALPSLVNAQTGRVHTSYNQTGTSTGRISSNTPNLQNIPIRSDLGREVRRAFVADAGKKLLSVDYSQVELRILAHISKDETLLEAFAQGQDIHAATAAAVYGIPLEDVTKNQRSFAKRVNFGLIYGMGAFRLARDSDLTLSEAKTFIDAYFARLPGVKQYLDETKQAARLGPIYTLFGRRREFPLLQKGGVNQNLIQADERVAINMPIQGTAADIMKRAMIDLYGALTREGLHGRMILQVHDELVLEVPEAEIQRTRDLVVQVMEGAYPMDAPLRANAQMGDNWDEMQTL